MLQTNKQWTWNKTCNKRRKWKTSSIDAWFRNNEEI